MKCRLKWYRSEILLQGDKVKLTITFKGREMQFQEIGRHLFKVRYISNTARPSCVLPSDQFTMTAIVVWHFSAGLAQSLWLTEDIGPAEVCG